MTFNTFISEDGQKQGMYAGPPGIKVETSAREQQKPEQYKMETIANEQGQPQMKIETSAKQQGQPGDAYAMQGKQRMTEAPNIAYAMQGKARMTEAPPAEDEEEAFQEESNRDLANAEQYGASWPYGRYALPKPRRGCPPGWSSGSRFSDNEDDNNINSESAGITSRMSVYVGSDTRMDYCVKTYAGSPFSGSWPRGNYCIARKGGRCPIGFSTGSVYWDDEDTANANWHSGTLPDGIYYFDTLIHFCCRSDGLTSTPMHLPTTRPFILYRKGDRSACQSVSGMRVRYDYIKTDDEDDFNINFCTGSHPATCGRDIRMNFCYYY